MESNIELLNYIYQNAEMGKTTISQLLDIVRDSEFRKVLESQYREYDKIYDEADNRIKKANETSKGIGTLTKLTTYLSININTLLDKSPAHIAEMMIQGSTMGIIDVTKRIKEYSSKDSDILKLADRLLVFEQQNVEEMKKFL